MEVVSSLAVRALEVVAKQSEDPLAMGLLPAPFAGAHAGQPVAEAAAHSRENRDTSSDAKSIECASTS